MFLDNDHYYDSSLINPLLLEIKNENAELLIYSSTNVYEIGYNSGFVWLRIFKRDVILNNNIKFKNNFFIFEDDLFSFGYMIKTLV